MKGETVTDSLPATPKSPPTRRVPPRGTYAAIVLYVITLCMADFTAKGFQSYYKDMDGISIPQPFCQSFTPFAVAIGWLLDRIPGFSKLDIDAEGMKKKFGILGEPLFLGLVIGCGIGALRCDSWKGVVDSIPSILKLGVMRILKVVGEMVTTNMSGCPRN